MLAAKRLRDYAVIFVLNGRDPELGTVALERHAVGQDVAKSLVVNVHVNGGFSVADEIVGCG